MQTATATRTVAKTTAVNTRPAKKPSVSNVYVAALKEAGGFHKSSFHIELAVCLAFYCEQEKADLKAKAALRPIYEKAGYDCKTPAGEDYKTIQRRISTAADFFTHLGGHETVFDWMDRTTGAKGIAILVAELTKRKLDNISVVKASSGKPAVRAYTKRVGHVQPTEAELKLAERVAGTPAPVSAVQALPPERVLHTEHMTCAIPLDVTQEEVKAMALKLLEFAATVMATPAPATAPVAGA